MGYYAVVAHFLWSMRQNKSDTRDLDVKLTLKCFVCDF